MKSLHKSDSSLPPPADGFKKGSRSGTLGVNTSSSINYTTVPVAITCVEEPLTNQAARPFHLRQEQIHLALYVDVEQSIQIGINKATDTDSSPIGSLCGLVSSGIGGQGKIVLIPVKSQKSTIAG